MKEKGIDILSNNPKMLTTEMIESASLVVTMWRGVEEVCPKPMLAQVQKKLVDWHLEDAKGKPIARCAIKVEQYNIELARACRKGASSL